MQRINNHQWNVSQVRSKDSAIIMECKHKKIYINIGMEDFFFFIKMKYKIKNKM